MATTPAAAPAPKRARVPYRPPLLSLWARNDLADNVVACLSPSTIPRLPVIAKAFRAAHPLVLFTAARRLGVAGLATRNFMSALRTASPERFRETWAEGLGRWQMDPQALGGATPLGAFVDISDPSPHLRLDRGPADGYDSDGPPADDMNDLYHRGLYRLFHPEAPAHIILRRLHTRVCFPNGLSGPLAGAVGHIWFSGDVWYPGSPAEVAGVAPSYLIGGLCATPRMPGISNTPTLVWTAGRMERQEDIGVNVPVHVPRNFGTALCPVTAGVWYDVEATFSNADNEGYMTATVVVSFSAQRITHHIRCLWRHLAVVKVYNHGIGTALVGDIDMEYTEEKYTP
jgi:hypothetical protein